MTRRNLAVFGLGSIGLRHARNALDLGQDVTGFDPDADRRALLADAGGKAVESREEAMAQAEAVIVASPNQLHRDDIAYAIACRRHVFAEKPFAHTAEGMADLLAMARSNDTVIFVAQNIRYHPAIREARQLLDENALGEILWARFVFASYLPCWRAGQDYRQGYANDPETGGILFDMVHEFDLAAHLLGSFEPAAAAARRTQAIDLSVDSSAAVVLRHRSGAFSTLTLDYATRPTFRRIEIAGTAGLLQMDLEKRTLLVTGTTGDALLEKTYTGSYQEDYVDEMRNFLGCISGVESPRCDGDEALQILTQVLATRELAGLKNLK